MELYRREQTRAKPLPSTTEHSPGLSEIVRCGRVCTVITPKVSSAVIWLLVSQQGFLVMDSVHSTLLFITLSYVAISFPAVHTVNFSSAEDSVSWSCRGVGAKSAVCVLRVMHTLKELNWPVIVFTGDLKVSFF